MKMNPLVHISEAVCSVIICAAAFFSTHPAVAYWGDTLNYIDVNGNRQGNWRITASMTGQKEFFHPEDIAQEGKYIDNKREDVWTLYYPNGNKSAVLTFRNNKLNGDARRYAENGVLISETIYLNGIPNGIAKEYYPDGTIWTVFTWQNSRLNGEARTYYPNGKLCETGNWVYRGWSGEYKLYYDNGNLYKSETKPLVY